MGGLNISDIPINGFLNGDIHFSNLLEHPRFYTNDFKINKITYLDDTLGTLTFNSIWDDAKKGMDISFSLENAENIVSSAGGFISPIKDIVNFNINIDTIPLIMAQSFLTGIASNISGDLSADMSINGKLSTPDILGYIYLKDASFMVDYTNVTYIFSDTIRFTPTKMEIKDMKIYDSNNQNANVNCSINHKNFSDINYVASIQMNEFMILNNPTKKDSILYGNFMANGNLNVKGDIDGLFVSGYFNNGKNTNVRLRLPKSITQAKTYDNIIYVSDICLTENQINNLSEEVIPKGFIIKTNIAVTLTEQATFGAIINSANGDEVSVTGNGNINVNYNSELSSVKQIGRAHV